MAPAHGEDWTRFCGLLLIKSLSSEYLNSLSSMGNSSTPVLWPSCISVQNRLFPCTSFILSCLVQLGCVLLPALMESSPAEINGYRNGRKITLGRNHLFFFLLQNLSNSLHIFHKEGLMHYLGTLFLCAFCRHGKSVLPQHYPTVLN